MRLKYIVFVGGFLSASMSWALFCPNNFNSINVGDTLDTVVAACGKPDAKTSNNKKAAQPQEWAYYIQANPAQPGTMKLTVAFDADGKAINVSVNGSGMPQTQLCANGQIQLGDTQDAVRAACGDPTYINQTEAGQKAEVPETQIVTLQYNSSPPETLVFEDGKLVGRK